jgi:hypothetical protein
MKAVYCIPTKSIHRTMQPGFSAASAVAGNHSRFAVSHNATISDLPTRASNTVRGEQGCSMPTAAVLLFAVGSHMMHILL